ncbi:DUF4350 domain-containing protein [Microbulbifer sp. CAU 1566]|uniref:DUF4350 domain-containing protein n=1 Tax=Microbulbifer sp. CAU 1566 TaxID=2933269 RepID=UPI002005E110|nr:DUF4350 domain-containing protein [Microbulbifer sp. CAU 1566]MCK7597834.1 DUF4350 domain-containing protein [Microbulbifer sp. CAU 1566]
MKLGRIAIAWVLLLLAAAAALFLFFFERYTEERDRGFGPEARRNPYLAAEQFLTRVGIRYRRADNIAAVSALGDNDVLFLTSSSQIYNASRGQELLGWIEQGGQAIVIAHGSDADNEQDYLLDMLGLEIARGEMDLYFNQQVREVFGDEITEIEIKKTSDMMRDHNRKLAEREKNKEKENEDAADSAEETAQENIEPRNPDIDPERLINLTSDSGASYALFFDTAKVFTHEMMNGEYTDTQIEGNRLHWVPFQRSTTQSPLVHYEYGRGRLTLMADGGLWRNHRIGDFDHAYFLAHLVGERELVMITRPHFDDLGTLAQRYALEFFVAGLLALMAWIANRSRRFGPMTPAPASERRSLLEHIRACGHFYWRNDRAAQLFEKARAPLLQKLSGQPAHMAQQLPPEKQRQIAESVAERSGLGRDDIYTVLWASPPHSEEDFTARLRSIQIIEAAL